MKPVPPDREVDRDVAVLLGWEQCPCGNPNCDFWHSPDLRYDADLPNFSTDITDAWQVVEYMIDRRMDVEIHCTRAQRNYFVLVHIIGGQKIRAYGDTPAAAIVAAFLKVMQ